MTKDQTNEAERELKACPFCQCAGCTVESGGRWYATCTSIDCRVCVGEGYDRDAMPDHCFATEAEAIAAWNTRPTDDLAVAVEALRKIASCESRIKGDVVDIARAALSKLTGGEA